MEEKYRVYREDGERAEEFEGHGLLVEERPTAVEIKMEAHYTG